MTIDPGTTVTRRHDGKTSADEAARQPRLVVAFECRRPFAPGFRVSLADVDEVTIGRGGDRRWTRAGRVLQVTLPDHEMSRLHVRLVRRPDGWNLHDAGSKNGTLVDGAPTSHCALADGDLIEVGGSFLIYRDEPVTEADPGDRDLAADPVMPEVFRTLSLGLERGVADLARIAPTLVPVLVTGETGTGKELAAEAIHALSGRRGPFVPINCGALPRTLVESELFGYRRGAFSGAKDDRMGLARKADGGTLFLDEVAELPEESQVALLRLLQNGEVRAIGSADLVKVDVRVIAATHQDLRARISEGRFRRDLYGRLCGYQMEMPALRDRPEDVGSLIAVLLRRIGIDDPALTINPRAAQAFFSHQYPMNVRELEQALRAAAALATDHEINVRHLPEGMRAPTPPSGKQLRPEDVALRAQLVEILRESDGNIAATARALDKAPVQIRRWCRRLGIDLAEYRKF